VYNPADAANPPPAPAPPPAPPPPDVGEIPQAPRYQYLVGRLRNRQITMEEATELFAIQRQQVALLLARTNALAAAAAYTPPSPRMPRPVVRPTTPTTPAPSFSMEGVDPWGEGLLFLALGAGVLAALMKSVRGAPPKAAARPPTSTSSTRQT
jgi:hypothetical protein